MLKTFLDILQKLIQKLDSIYTWYENLFSKFSEQYKSFKKLISFYTNKLVICIENNIVNLKKNLSPFLNKLNTFNEFKESFDKKYFQKEERSAFLNLQKNTIVKQNKSLTPFEILSSIISSKGNKSYFYLPLHSFIPFFISSFVLIFLIVLIALFFRDSALEFKHWPFFVSLFGLSVCIAFWFSMFWFEKKLGKHSDIIKHNILFGFYLFILTEGLCFVSLFWTFLHSTLAASVHIGIFNPGEGVVNFYLSELHSFRRLHDLFVYNTFGTPCFNAINSGLMSDLYFSINTFDDFNRTTNVYINLFDSGTLINPWGLPLINTFILLASAASLNASHCFVLSSRFFSSLIWLFVTIIFGILFVFMQFSEYKNCALNYNDGIYASCFFGITGLHGIHVILGIFSLSVCFFNLLLKNYSPNFHQSFYFSIFYWHFVDVIWIFVWLVVYLWPASFFFKSFYLSCHANNFFVFNMDTNYYLNKIDLNAWYSFFYFDHLLYSSFENFDISNHFEKKVVYFDIINSLDNSLFIQDSYAFFLENRKKFNFNLLKKDPNFYASFLTEFHYDFAINTLNPTFDDVKNKYYRFLLFVIFYNCVPNFILSLYCNFFFSPWYLYNI